MSATIVLVPGVFVLLGVLAPTTVAEGRQFPLTVEDSVRKVTVHGVKRAHGWNFNPMTNARQASDGHHIVVVSYSRDPVGAGSELPPVELALLDSKDKQCRSLPEVLVTAGRAWRGFEIPEDAKPKQIMVDGLVIDLSEVEVDATIHDEVGIGEP